MKRMKSFVV